MPDLAARLGRTEDAVTLKAGRLGLTNIKRKGVNVRADAPKFTCPVERKNAQSNAAKRRISENGHPRGMLGKRHTEQVKDRLRATSTAAWEKMTESEKDDRCDKISKSRVASLGSFNGPRSRGSWKAGWREIGGRRNYYRSRWEANYARYLEWLRQRGEISDWRHEPETFWFEAIKRGVRSYLPDFRVWENDGTSKLHEVKGWMDSRSKTTLKRMAKYHPSESIILIKEKDYNAIAKTVGRMIDGWEEGSRAGRY